MADDITTDAPPEGTEFSPAGSLEEARAPQLRERGGAGRRCDAGQHRGCARHRKLTDSFQKLAGSAGDKAKGYAEDGKAKATAALGEFSQHGGRCRRTGRRDVRRAIRSVCTVGGGLYRQAAAGPWTARTLTTWWRMCAGSFRRARRSRLGTAAALGFVLSRVLRSGHRCRQDGRLTPMMEQESIGAIAARLGEDAKTFVRAEVDLQKARGLALVGSYKSASSFMASWRWPRSTWR